VNDLHAQLVHAYAREEELYILVADLAGRQVHAMEADANPRNVFDVCRRVEALMDEIAGIEQAIGPAKAAWEATRSDPDGALNAVLTRIQQLIADAARRQERVQELLLDYVRRQKEASESARASVNASRAQRLYTAG
jgi:hypothetical protein